MVPAVTLVELVEAVLECAGSEAEAVATIAYMVNARKIRLAGTFRDVRFDLRAMVPRQAGTSAGGRTARGARRARLWAPA